MDRLGRPIIVSSDCEYSTAPRVLVPHCTASRGVSDAASLAFESQAHLLGAATNAQKNAANLHFDQQALRLALFTEDFRPAHPGATLDFSANGNKQVTAVSCLLLDRITLDSRPW